MFCLKMTKQAMFSQSAERTIIVFFPAFNEISDNCADLGFCLALSVLPTKTSASLSGLETVVARGNLARVAPFGKLLGQHPLPHCTFTRFDSASRLRIMLMEA